MTAVISPQAAKSLIGQPSVVVLDASIGVPDARGNFEARHLPGAQFFDVEAIADHTSPYPHTLPSYEVFALAAGNLGIDHDTDIVIYDQNGITFAASRAWWMFRVFGHDRVSVINGGLPAWINAGLPVENGTPAPVTPKVFSPVVRPELYRSFEDMERISESGSETILDARPPMRFEAQAHTMDGDVVASNIPGSLNLPFQSLLDSSGAMKDSAAIEKVLENYPIHSSKKTVVTCGSGITACVVALGFFQTGHKNIAVFDGSWAEWSDRQNIRA